MTETPTFANRATNVLHKLINRGVAEWSPRRDAFGKCTGLAP